MKSKNQSSEVFLKFGKHFPFSVVDVIILDEEGSFLLTKRAISPYKNKWHFPGGMIRKNILMKKMVKIIAKNETNLDVHVKKFVGVYEIKSSHRHDISHVYLTYFLKGVINLDFQSTEAKFFKHPPKNMIHIQKKMWFDAKRLLKEASHSKMH